MESIKNIIKKNLSPKTIYKIRSVIYYPVSIFSLEYGRYLLSNQPKFHKKALIKAREKIKRGEKLRVAFFALYSSAWKYDELFQKMLSSPFYDPVIIICPVVNKGIEHKLKTMNESVDLFKKKKYPFIVSYDEKEKKYLNVKKEIKPDLIFYTNPYRGLIDDRYFITKFSNVLTCYVPYAFFPVEGYWVFDQLLQNLCWLIFAETPFHIESAKKYQKRKAANMVYTGYPGCDPLLFNKQPQNNVWKNTGKNNLKKIIWAPHHIDVQGFIDTADVFNEIVYKYQDKIQFTFKPHPLLEVKLKDYWDEDRIEAYYQFWQNLPNGQYENTDYVDLFLESDAMIHNSGSFITEYFCTRKPCISLHSEESLKELSDFGIKIINLHYRISIYEIDKYINNVILNNNDYMKEERLAFIDKYIMPPNHKTATENIYDTLNNMIINNN